MKKCPFRKNTIVINDHYDVQFVPICYEEEFADCIGSECMAWKEGSTDEYIPYVWNYCELTQGH